MAVYVFYWFLECSTYERLQLWPEHTDSPRFLTYCTTSCFRFECHHNYASTISKYLSYFIFQITSSIWSHVHIVGFFSFFFSFEKMEYGSNMKLENYFSTEIRRNFLLFMHDVHVHARQITLFISISIWILLKIKATFFKIKIWYACTFIKSLAFDQFNSKTKICKKIAPSPRHLFKGTPYRVVLTNFRFMNNETSRIGFMNYYTIITRCN